LAEVVAGLGVEKLHQTMPEIIKTAERTDIAPHVSRYERKRVALETSNECEKKRKEKLISFQ
jgi:hypothetical protein